MVFKRFPTESHDDIRSEGTIRQHLLDLPHALQIALASIDAAHFLQHFVAARLHRQMDALADVVVTGHRLDQLVGNILRMRCGEPHAQFRRHLRHHRHQLRKRDFLTLFFPVIGVHILS